MLEMMETSPDSVNLPRWGLKPGRLMTILSALGVNLPRWGLKLCNTLSLSLAGLCVNLPRWGLKQKSLIV